MIMNPDIPPGSRRYLPLGWYLSNPNRGGIFHESHGLHPRRDGYIPSGHIFAFGQFPIPVPETVEAQDGG